MKKEKIKKILKKQLKYIKFKYEILEENDRLVKIRYTEYKEIPYEALVIKSIRKRFTLDQELAILRQKETKPEEFADYNSYVEQCKAEAKQFVTEREADRLPKEPKGDTTL